MNYCSIRGATTAKSNTKEEIIRQTMLVLMEIMEKNELETEDIISIIFSATSDLDRAYPAVAARKLGILNAGLMCFQEMYVRDSLKRCIRLLVNVKTEKKQSEVIHVYLNRAKKLRPDLVEKDEGYFSIAIDGPAGSGKSTVAKIIAQEKGFIYVDTGAMYRAVGLYCIRNDKYTTDVTEVTKELPNIDISFIHKDGGQRIYLNGEDVTDHLRTQDVAKASSEVAAIESVRDKLVQIQRKLARENNVVMEGRDIGTFVLPDATVKVYLDASVDERTERRCGELNENEIEFDYDTVKREIIDRDDNDMNREFSPLRKAYDAIIIDTTGKSIDDVKKEIYNLF